MEQSPKKVLVVDDEKDLRDAIVTALSYEGFEVTGAADGLEALAAADAERPHLILLDISMPNMDGIEVLKQLRTFPWAQKIPIIIMTVLDDPGKIADAVEGGATEYMVKSSIPLGTIVRKVKERLGSLQ